MSRKTPSFIVELPLEVSAGDERRLLGGVYCRCSAVVMSETVEYVQAPVLWGLFTWKKVAKKECQRTEDRLRDSQSMQQVVGYVVMAASGIVGSIAIF